MRITIGGLCTLVEKSVPGTHCTPIPNSIQIRVTFNYRPDKVVTLLTPYLQVCLKRGEIPDDDLHRLIEEVRGIATFRIL